MDFIAAGITSPSVSLKRIYFPDITNVNLTLHLQCVCVCVFAGFILRGVARFVSCLTELI